jgi:MinD superfamily P-loop ATPase
MYVCPQQAIREASRVIGVTRDYQSSQVRLISGHLNPSERMGVPLVRKVKRQAHSSDLVIIDAPPGSSCPMVAAVQDADVLVLVAEPTPFGVSDLNLVIEVAAKLGLPYGVVINRCDIGDDCLYRMCQDSGIPILAQIPNERSIAVAYSKGIPLLKALPDFKPLFQDLLSKIIDVVPNDSQSQRRYVC